MTRPTSKSDLDLEANPQVLVTDADLDTSRPARNSSGLEMNTVGPEKVVSMSSVRAQGPASAMASQSSNRSGQSLNRSHSLFKERIKFRSGKEGSGLATEVDDGGKDADKEYTKLLPKEKDVTGSQGTVLTAAESTHSAATTSNQRATNRKLMGVRG
jgi:hypothetical protein